MIHEEACRLLGVQAGASKEEVTKAFRKRAAELHPDVNKEPDAEERFKKVNEAHQFLKNNGTSPPPPRTHQWSAGPFWAPTDFGGSFHRVDDFTVSFGRKVGTRVHVNTSIPKVKASVSISFDESITGCTKEVTITKGGYCKVCNGNKTVRSETDEPCEYCNGKGTRSYAKDAKEMKCTFCDGSGNMRRMVQCNACLGSGIMDEKERLTVSIPPGILSGQRVRIRNKGEDALIDVSVISDPEMMRSGNDVISIIKLSLLEALKGGKKQVRTVKGMKSLKIKSGVKNKETIRVNGYGVPPIGSHNFIVDISYPEDTSRLIEFLENEEPKPDEEQGE